MDGDFHKGLMLRWQTKLTGSLENPNANDTSKISSIPAAVNFKGKSSGASGSKTSNGGAGGDRFIPNRASSNFNLAHHKMKIAQSGDENEGHMNYQKTLSEAMQFHAERIFSYQEKPKPALESHRNPFCTIHSTPKSQMSTKNGSREIPQTSEDTLDAPEFINDYYLNLMDWSATNVLTLALGNAVYLWNAGTRNTELLKGYENDDHACSLAWIQHGNVLAIGSTDGTIELWDAETKKQLRVMDGHTARVGSLAWNSFIVSSGSGSGSIVHHDVRQREHKIATLLGHACQVCGLKWSTDFKYLASGGNDNLVKIWPTIIGSNARANKLNDANEALYVFSNHRAAIRAMAWCPWQPNILATGGGIKDRCIKFWNINYGNLIDSVDTESQVCALQWSKTYNEIISAHGCNSEGSGNQLTIWKYPSMRKQCELHGHARRILHMAMSPDGSKVMSASADETLRLWNCFAPNAHQAKKELTATKHPPSLLRPNIR